MAQDNQRGLAVPAPNSASFPKPSGYLRLWFQQMCHFHCYQNLHLCQNFHLHQSLRLYQKLRCQWSRQWRWRKRVKRYLLSCQTRTR